MSDIVEDVAKSISFRTAAPQQTHPRWDFLHPDEQNVWRRKAKAAIAAAEPHLRRKHRQELLDELIESIDSNPTCLFGVLHGGDCFDGPVINWLTAKKRKEAE